ncbi:MAG: exodeoxyribonuclease V subunit alpha [Pseudomonadales bacterium]|nr:exodeoxyribonuclease V subunit alpha [Pseudomonadales bacterium]
MSEQGSIRPVDTYLADFLARLEGGVSPGIYRLFISLGQALGRQDSCIRLDAGLAEEVARLSIVSSDGSQPLILDGERLYLHKYYRFECEVAEQLRTRNEPLVTDKTLIAKALATRFPAQPDTDWQAVAAWLALTRKLVVITGGPGTGKTTTVSKILETIMETAAHGGEQAPLIQLTAPTGKAAMRLSEGLRRHSSAYNIPTEVTTIHRLLGRRADGASWRHDASNPLRAELLIVDEASMIDLALMKRLLSALRPDCRLILLGDPEQLPSVDTGNVLMDICKESPPFSEELAAEIQTCLGYTTPASLSSHGLQNAVCQLQKSYRFSASSGLGQMAGQIRAGQLPQSNGAVRVEPLQALTGQLASGLAAFYDAYFHALQAGASLQELLSLFDQQRILTTMREGSLGVRLLNELIEDQAARRGLKRPGQLAWHGRPVMIRRNDYHQQLFNGDTGICITTGNSGDYAAAFPEPQGDYRTVLMSRLPAHETCFAMTIHKSQGSEFDRVMLIVPDAESEQSASLLTRELLYTGLTRARDSAIIYANTETLETAISRYDRRFSGLTERLK